MSNYHSDKWILNNINKHYQESLKYFSESSIIGIFYQGSGNYGLDTQESDVDTKLILAPTLKEIALNKKRISTTHIRANQEHIDWKDVSLYFETFYKQNLNFVEILFTQYYILNDLYKKPWTKLLNMREEVAHLNPYRAVKTMKGIALEKFHAMEHRYPSRAHLIDTYGYDGKQVSHLVRVRKFLDSYISGKSYEDCLHPTSKDFIIALKQNKYNLEDGRRIARDNLEHILSIANKYCEEVEDKYDEKTREAMNDILYDIIKIAIKEELK